MTDEEKKAIEILENFEPDDLVEYAMYRNGIEKIKNLIENQQKEIEELNIKINEIIELFQRYSFTCRNGNITIPQYLIIEILGRETK